MLAALLIAPAAAALTEYCPSADDLTIAYTTDPSSYTGTTGVPQLVDQGWSIHGGGGVATKSAFNLLGGYVTYDIDLSKTNPGVNANIYTISPKNIAPTGYVKTDYCDGAATGSDWCIEVDWIESNGNCGGATTLHTIEGPGYPGCTAWGCRAQYNYNGQANINMRIDYTQDGQWSTTHNGQTIGPNDLDPGASDKDWQILESVYATSGAVIYSSQWVGWVPTPDGCSGNQGDLDSSFYAIDNLKIYGEVTQGPIPRTCAQKAIEDARAANMTRS